MLNPEILAFIEDTICVLRRPICLPTSSQVLYRPDGEVSGAIYYDSTTQVDANRIAQVEFTYDSLLNPITEDWNLYEDDGVTVKKQVQINHTYTVSGFDLVSTERICL